MVPESGLETTEHGLVPAREGWFVLNAHDAPWYERDGRGFYCEFGGFDGRVSFVQYGLNVTVLRPGEPMAMYHWEADQEDFLVVSGEALAIVEGEERRLRPWDLLHCPAGTEHVIVGGRVGTVRHPRGRCARALDWPGVGRVHRRFCRPARERRRRAGDD